MYFWMHREYLGVAERLVINILRRLIFRGCTAVGVKFLQNERALRRPAPLAPHFFSTFAPGPKLPVPEVGNIGYDIPPK